MWFNSFHLILTTKLWGRYYFHFTYEGTEDQLREWGSDGEHTAEPGLRMAGLALALLLQLSPPPSFCYSHVAGRETESFRREDSVPNVLLTQQPVDCKHELLSLSSWSGLLFSSLKAWGVSMDVITAGTFTRAMFTYLRNCRKIERPLWAQGCSLPSHQVDSVDKPQVHVPHHQARSKEWPQHTGPFISGEGSSRRATPSRLAKLCDHPSCPFWGQAGCSLASEILRTHRPSAQWELENLWPKYLRTCYWSSDMFRSNQVWNFSVSRNHDLGVGIFKVQKRQVHNTNSSLMKETALLKLLVLLNITSWAK